MCFTKTSGAAKKIIKPLALCFAICFFAGLMVFSYLPTAKAEITMSKDPKSMQAKGQTLNAKSKTRTRAAVERMKRILKEKREGKRGFDKDFATIPGPK